MIPRQIKLQNFLAYRDPDPLRFDGIHVACLVGPNGAGKSTLLDAITWCLWGKARTNTADELIHQGESDMSVNLVFGQAGNQYQVIRQRKAGKRGSSLLEFQIRDVAAELWRPLSEGTIRETQARIDELLRLDYETFVNSAFLVQGRADEFTTKTPGQRKEVLSSILGLDQWQHFEEQAKGAIRTVEQQSSRLEGKLQEIEGELVQEKDYQEELDQAQAEASEAAEKVAKVEDEWASLEQSRKDLVQLQRQIDELTRRILQQEKDLAEGEIELARLLERADRQAIEAALAEARHQVAALEAVEKSKGELETRRRRLSEEAASLRGANRALAPETEPIKERVESLRSTTEPQCPTCGQPLTNEHREQLLSELEQEIEERRQRYRDNRARIEELDDLLADVKQKLEVASGQLTQRPQAEKRVGELEAALTHAAESAEQSKALQSKIKRWREARAMDQKQRANIEAKAAETEKTLKVASLTQSDIDNLRKQKRLADERVGGARQKLAALDQLKKQLEKSQVERQQLGEQLSMLEELREAFSKRGVPAMIIETVVPELERSANDLLARMTNGRLHVRIETQREIKTGELREALDIIISDELGSRPYELYSGGEAFRINFAIRIALSKLLANRAGAQLRSLFIDEGFGTQDAQGREQLIEAINSIEGDFDLILVITHIEDLKDVFPTRIEVRKTPEGSQFSLN